MKSGTHRTHLDDENATGTAMSTISGMFATTPTSNTTATTGTTLRYDTSARAGTTTTGTTGTNGSTTSCTFLIKIFCSFYVLV